MDNLVLERATDWSEAEVTVYLRSMVAMTPYSVAFSGMDGSQLLQLTDEHLCAIITSPLIRRIFTKKLRSLREIQLNQTSPSSPNSKNRNCGNSNSDRSHDRSRTATTLSALTSVDIRGLCNLGNTCFFNSVLQSLLHSPGFIDYFLRFDSSNLRTDYYYNSNSNSNGLLREWIKLCHEYYKVNQKPDDDDEYGNSSSSSRYKNSYGWRYSDSVSPNRFLQALHEIDSTYGRGTQEDAYLVMIAILSALDTQINHNNNINNNHFGHLTLEYSNVDDNNRMTTEDERFWMEQRFIPNNNPLREENIIRHLMHGVQRETLTCVECGFETRTYMSLRQMIIPTVDCMMELPSITCYIIVPVPVPVSAAAARQRRRLSMTVKGIRVLKNASISVLKYQLYHRLLPLLMRDTLPIPNKWRKWQLDQISENINIGRIQYRNRIRKRKSAQNMIDFFESSDTASMCMSLFTDENARDNPNQYGSAYRSSRTKNKNRRKINSVYIATVNFCADRVSVKPLMNMLVNDKYSSGSASLQLLLPLRLFVQKRKKSSIKNTDNRNQSRKDVLECSRESMTMNDEHKNVSDISICETNSEILIIYYSRPEMEQNIVAELQEKARAKAERIRRDKLEKRRERKAREKQRKMYLKEKRKRERLRRKEARLKRKRRREERELKEQKERELKEKEEKELEEQRERAETPTETADVIMNTSTSTSDKSENGGGDDDNNNNNNGDEDEDGGNGHAQLPDTDTHENNEDNGENTKNDNNNDIAVTDNDVQLQDTKIDKMNDHEITEHQAENDDGDQKSEAGEESESDAELESESGESSESEVPLKPIVIDTEMLDFDTLVDERISVLLSTTQNISLNHNINNSSSGDNANENEIVDNNHPLIFDVQSSMNIYLQTIVGDDQVLRLQCKTCQKIAPIVNRTRAIIYPPKLLLLGLDRTGNTYYGGRGRGRGKQQRRERNNNSDGNWFSRKFTNFIQSGRSSGRDRDTSFKLDHALQYPLHGLHLRGNERGQGKRERISDDDNLYDLYAVCNHSGSNHGGHYYAAVRSVQQRNDLHGNEQWYSVSDSSHHTVSNEEVVNRNAILLMYKKR